jgi:hypothetical protein
MVPFVSLVFAFTNAVGAALWAADLEKSGQDPDCTPDEQAEAVPKVE